MMTDEDQDSLINRMLLEAAGLIPFEGEEESFETVGSGFEEEEEQIDISMILPSDFLDWHRENHRRSLKMNHIHYKVAWMDGFTYGKGTPIPYKVGTRMRKVFDAGRRARHNE